MALIKCPECKKKISSKVKACPHCGSPIKQKFIFSTRIILLGVLFILIAYIKICTNDLDNKPNIPQEKSEELKKLESTFGEKPKPSIYDGSIKIVKDYITTIAKDPDSVKYEKWSDISYHDTDGWIVKVKYRGKNSFGGYVINCNSFTIKFSKVTSMKPCNAYE